MHIEEHDRPFRRDCERVIDALASKWDAPSAEDPLAPWVVLAEVMEATGLTTFAARRALQHLSTREPQRVYYEPATKATRSPAKWVLLDQGNGDWLADLGSPPGPALASPRAVNDMSLRHITSDYA